MNAVWRAARAAVRRRRLQTVVIGVVVLFSTAALVVAVALLDASSAPFERAFAAQRGAHVVAAFEPGTPDEDLEATAAAAGVAAAAGPFDQVVLELGDDPGALVPGLTGGPLTVVGRDDPAGDVDRVDLWKGSWPDAPGEIVLNVVPDPDAPDEMFALGTALDFNDGRSMVVVGYAYSLSGTADAWVGAEQAAALDPTASQMLYRLDAAANQAEIEEAEAAITAGLPADALLASQSYLLVKEAVAAGPGVYVPFLVVFGVLGIAMAVLIVANVVSGAVVSGFKHIGVLKTLGFTPRQVVAVYLVMVSVPASIGSAAGTALGTAAAGPLVSDAFQGLGFAGDTGARPWVVAAALLGMPLVVLLAALVPASRARRLSAAAAISAGSAPRPRRGSGLQHRLAGTRLPRAVSLGLGLPAARPGRSLMTMSSVVLAVTTVTFATGLVASVTAYQEAADRVDAYQVSVYPGEGGTGPELGDAETEALLRSLDGSAHVTANLIATLDVVGHNKSVDVSFLRGDHASLDYPLVAGRWLEGPGEVAAPSAVLDDYGLEVGDEVVLASASGRGTATVVGELMSGGPGPDGFFADWDALPGILPDHTEYADTMSYYVGLADGADPEAFMAEVEAADPGRTAWENEPDLTAVMGVVGAAVALTVMLAAVAAVGVFNTVVLNTRERRRDLAMLKSIGMTPRQVVAMTVTSMAALGAVGGLAAIPLGVLAHRLVIPLVAEAARVKLPESLLAVWQAPELAALAFAGAVIAVLGAWIPARSAARMTIADALRSE